MEMYFFFFWAGGLKVKGQRSKVEDKILQYYHKIKNKYKYNKNNINLLEKHCNYCIKTILLQLIFTLSTKF